MSDERPNTTRRQRLRVRGVVQGVGFRPFVWRRANEFGLTGWVRNDSYGVTIEIQGTGSAVNGFLEGFRDAMPPLARIDSLQVTDGTAVTESQFFIHESLAAADHSTPISPDISVCGDCLRELYDPLDRRFQYPFINCTNCGPRFTVVEDIPYDRRLTTMKPFSMCRACQREYDTPGDRRFHAQPNACPVCGPTVWFVTNQADDEAFIAHPQTDTDPQGAIRDFQHAMRLGLVVAVKGLGGFHLACDASNGTAIAKLRECKGRVQKPLAVMVRDVEQAATFANVAEHERRLLESRERPIVLLCKRTDPQSDFIPHASVAPGINFIGVMLPYSPLHYLLIDNTPLVLTSGNISDEPIARTNREAQTRLRGLADCFLLHDREISVACDDSVMRCVEGKMLPIRRSRGYAPLPLELPDPGPSVLAVGGDIKSTCCVTKDNYAYLSQHLGDMGNLETLEAMQQSVEHLVRLFRVDVEAVAADLHPGYLSGHWAQEFAKSLGVPLIRVQHHFAHVAALMAEHGVANESRFIGCCFDGTGYGTDHAIWGGEFIIADAAEYVRFAHLKYTPLPGGDASVRRPYRMALAQLWASGLDWDRDLPCVAACSTGEQTLLRRQLERNLNCVSTSSMGRLFDAIASLVGIRHEVNYEAQAAMELESLAVAASDHVDPQAYAFKIKHNSVREIDSAPLLEQIVKDFQSGMKPEIMAAQFHHAVASLVVEVCQAVRTEARINTVGLTGGVFQNVLLLRLTTKRLVEAGFEVLTHSYVPPNDGGIALGQALVVRKQWQALLRD